MKRFDHPQFVVWSIFLLCIIIGPLNFVLYKVMYTAYGSERSYFVSQCVNIQYVIIGGIALFQAYLKGEITEEMRKTPHIKFVIMGLLDCFAGFLSAMGASHTSGATQQLLNQSLIPCTMFFSWVFLGNHSTVMEMIGASVILLGAFIVILPSFTQDNASSQFQFLSILIYFSSNIPFAASYCYKEYGFKNLFIHVLYLTQWVSIYQLLIGFLLFPLQTLPGMGSPTGMSFSEIFINFHSGISCFFESTTTTNCQHKNTFFLLTGYCCVNFIFNTSGLYLVKHGSATMNSISYAIILPLTTLAFSSSWLLGPEYSEPFRAETLYGLGVVLLGFVLWKGKSLWQTEEEGEGEVLLGGEEEVGESGQSGGSEEGLIEGGESVDVQMEIEMGGTDLSLLSSSPTIISSPLITDQDRLLPPSNSSSSSSNSSSTVSPYYQLLSLSGEIRPSPSSPSSSSHINPKTLSSSLPAATLSRPKSRSSSFSSPSSPILSAPSSHISSSTSSSSSSSSSLSTLSHITHYVSSFFSLSNSIPSSASQNHSYSSLPISHSSLHSLLLILPTPLPPLSFQKPPFLFTHYPLLLLLSLQFPPHHHHHLLPPLLLLPHLFFMRLNLTSISVPILLHLPLPHFPPHPSLPPPLLFPPLLSPLPPPLFPLPPPLVVLVLILTPSSSESREHTEPLPSTREPSWLE